MARVCAIVLGALLGSVPAVAESVSIELTPQGALALQLTAPDQAKAESLGAALSRSLGCKLSDVRTQARGAEWEYRARCSGVFQRRGQVLDGQLKLAGFRQALIKSEVDEIQVDLGVPDAPYSRGAFPKSLDRICRNGVVHQKGLVEPRDLPARPIRVAVGYRTAELVMIFGPLPLALLMSLGLVLWLNRKAAKAGQIDPRVLWFSYVRSLARGLTGIFLAWSAVWAAIAGAFGGDQDVWALYSVWNGGSVITGRLMATSFYLLPAILAAVLCALFKPKAIAGLSSLKTLLAAALILIVPAAWTLGAFGALGSGEWLHVFSRIVVATVCAAIFRLLMRLGRGPVATVLASGEVKDRLQALAVRCGTQVNEIHVLPMRAVSIAEPMEVAPGRVALTDYAMETMEPAEIEAEVARRWSLPLRDRPDLRAVMVFLVAMGLGMLLSLAALVVLAIPLGALQLLLHVRVATLSARLSLAFAVVFAVLVGRSIQRWLVRRADRKAAVLVGSPELVAQVSAKMAAMTMWGTPAAVAPAVSARDEQKPSPVSQTAPRIFSSAWRSKIANLQAYGTLLTLSMPPVAVALAVRAGLIPAAARWPAYLSGMMLALLMRTTMAKVVDCRAYRRLRSKLAARMQIADERALFVGLSPEPRPLVYDGAWDWDIGFLKLSAERLDYQGEQARFTLRREHVTEVRVAKGAPQWSDPEWVYLSWRDPDSGRGGTIPLILPPVRSPWKLSRHVRELHKTLASWKNGSSGSSGETTPATPEMGLPEFPADTGVPRPNQLPHMAAMIAVGGLGLSLVARFPIGSEATLYFALVWSANVLLDLFGHRLVVSSEATAA